jgi:hypothetical protein
MDRLRAGKTDVLPFAPGEKHSGGAAISGAAAVFLHWCEARGMRRLQDVQPVHVAAYIEQWRGERSAPTVKQHLAGRQLRAVRGASAIRTARGDVIRRRVAPVCSKPARAVADSVRAMTLAAVVALRRPTSLSRKPRTVEHSLLVIGRP